MAEDKRVMTEDGSWRRTRGEDKRVMTEGRCVSRADLCAGFGPFCGGFKVELNLYFRKVLLVTSLNVIG